MHPQIHLEEIKKNIVSELVNAREGKPSSFPYIRHKLSQTSVIKDGEVFQTIAVGGSFYRNALLQKKNGQITILESNTAGLPVFDTKDTFLHFMQERIDNSIRHLAVNFAYPLTPVMRNSLLDGILQSGSKEHPFTGLVNETVGEAVEIHMRRVLNREIHVAVANDTICQLLSGIEKYPWDSLAAGIVGTGLNFAVFQDKYTAVNLESGNFNKFTKSEEATVIDGRSASPGSAVFEKEISGGYLFQLFNEHIKKNNINQPFIESTDTLDELSLSGNEQVAAIAQSFLNRSAHLVGAQIAGILEYMKRDQTFIMQGSLYWKGNLYRQTVEDTVKKLTDDYTASYVRIDDSDILGPAELLIRS